MAYKLVFIDDNMKDGLNDAFVRAIDKKLKELDQAEKGHLEQDLLEEVSVFTDPDKGLEFIMANLNSQMIAFVDCKFDGYAKQGIDVLKEIRKTTSLLYIVMMSANNINQIEGLDITAMVNEDFIWFYDRNNGSVESACSLIGRIKKLWGSRFDCVLERWLVSHPSDMQKIAFRQAGTAYTWEQILSELRRQTEVGRLFEEMINKYYIYQLTEKQ